MAQQIPVTVAAALGRTNYRKTSLLLLSSMRPHQWVKNLFVLAPLLFSMRLDEPTAIINAIFAFLVFCLLSSGLYLINDITDARADRNHPEKRLRPVASGALPTRVALTAAVILFVIAATGALNLGLWFSIIALAYGIVVLGYCLAFKQALILDAMLIATGFVLRVVGGAVAIAVIPTHWLIVCAFLLALFLAFSKRRQELLILSGEAAKHRSVLNQYSIGFLDQANNILLGATIVCYALYTVAPETVERFGTDGLIYGTAFVIYGLLRYLALLNDAQKGGNPSRMLVADKPLLLAVVGWAIYNSAVIYRSQLGF